MDEPNIMKHFSLKKKKNYSLKSMVTHTQHTYTHMNEHSRGNATEDAKSVVTRI